MLEQDERPPTTAVIGVGNALPGYTADDHGRALRQALDDAGPASGDIYGLIVNWSQL